MIYKGLNLINQSSPLRMIYILHLFIFQLNIQLGMFQIHIQHTLLYWRVYRCITNTVICSYKVTVMHTLTLILIILYLTKPSFQRSKSKHFVDKPMLRNNLDLKHPNKSGKLLLEMCKETDLRILNSQIHRRFIKRIYVFHI